MQTEDSEFGRFTVLLCALASFMCVLPFMPETGAGVVVLRVGTTLLLLAAVYSVSERRWQLVLAIVLASPAVGAQLVPSLIGEQGTLMLRMAMSAAVSHLHRELDFDFPREAGSRFCGHDSRRNQRLSAFCDRVSRSSTHS